MFCAPSCFFSFFVLRGDEREGKPILSLSGPTVSILYSERPPAFERVSSCVRSCLVPRSVVPRPAFAEKYRDCSADALLYGVQDRILAATPSHRRYALARTIVCCGASIVAHFAAKVSYSASPQSSPNVRAAVLFTALARM